MLLASPWRDRAVLLQNKKNLAPLLHSLCERQDAKQLVPGLSSESRVLTHLPPWASRAARRADRELEKKQESEILSLVYGNIGNSIARAQGHGPERVLLICPLTLGCPC